MADSTLSSADSALLDRIFNPTGIDFGSAPSSSSALDDGALYSDLDASTLRQLRIDEAQAVALAESDDLDVALNLLNDIIARAPTYYSALNNRAQVFQLLKRPADAMTDLTSAIQHAERTGNTLVARQAYTQRGFLRQVFDKDDEAARIDFEHGARLGGVVAKREAIKLNPYAQLCNQMVTQAMQAHQSCTAAAEPPEKPSR